MTQVKLSSFDIGKKGIPPSRPVSNHNMCWTLVPFFTNKASFYPESRGESNELLKYQNKPLNQVSVAYKLVLGQLG